MGVYNGSLFIGQKIFQKFCRILGIYMGHIFGSAAEYEKFSKK